MFFIVISFNPVTSLITEKIIMKVCLSVLQEKEFALISKFINSLGFNAVKCAKGELSESLLLLNSIIIVDNKSLEENYAVLRRLKMLEKSTVYLMLWLPEEAATIEIPDFIDDVIFPPFNKIVWKKRFITFNNFLKRLNRLMINRNEDYDALFFNNKSVILLIDPLTGKIEDANPAACTFYGYSCKQITRMRIQQINTLPEEVVVDKMRIAFQNSPAHFEFKHRLANGTIKDVNVYSGVIKFKGKELLYSIIHDMSRAVAAENLLNESIENYKTIIENAADSIVVVDDEGKITYLNKQVTTLTGYSVDELLGKKIVELFSQKEQKKISGIINSVLKKEVPSIRTSSFITTKSGNNIEFVSNSTFIRVKGKPAVLSIVRDISDYHLTLKELRASKRTFEDIFNSTFIPKFIINRKGNLARLNKSALKMFGKVKEDTLLQTPFVNIFVKNRCDFAKINHAIKLAFEGIPQQFEAWVSEKEGVEKPKLVIIERSTYINEEVLFAYFVDITRQKETEEALLKSKENYRLLFEESPFGIFTTDINGNILEANISLIKILNSPSVAATKNINVLTFQPLIKAGYSAVFKRCVNEGKVLKHEMLYTSAWGRILYTETTFVPLKDNNGNIIKVYTILRDITDQKKAEEKLEESRQLFKTLANASPVGIFRTDVNGNNIYVNPMWSEITGLSGDEANGVGWQKMLHPEDKESSLSEWYNSVTKANDNNTRFRIIKPDGEVRWVQGSSVPEYSNHKLVGFIGTITDISDLINTQKVLHESENKFRSLAEASKDLIVALNPNGKITYVNPAVNNLLGYNSEEVKGQSFWRYVADKYVDLTMRNFNKGLRGEKIPLYEIELIHKAGTLIPFELSLSSLLDDDGKIIGRQVVARDITERRRVRQILEKNEKRHKALIRQFRLMTDNMPDLIWTKDMQGRFTFVNKSVCDVLLHAKDTEEPIGKTDMFFAERERKLGKGRKNWHTFGELCVDSDSLVLQEKRPMRFEEYGNIRGKFLYLDVSKAPIFDEKNKIIGTVGHARIVTKEKAAEKELLLRDKALNSAANAIIITDATGKIEWVNKAFTDLCGYSEEEAIGRDTNELIGSENRSKEFVDNLNNTLLSGKVWKGEFVDKHKDGHYYVVEEVITPVPDENGKVVHLIGIMTDITERKERDKELREAKEAAEESSRLKSAFLTNMNHEIRTPMNAIMGFSSLLSEATSEEKNHYADIIFTSSEQLLKLIDDVIFLSRLQSEKLPLNESDYSPEKMVTDVVNMFNLPQLRKNLLLKTNIDKNVKNLFSLGDEDKIRQVLSNLISNAIKYTKKGSVEIGVKIVENNILFTVKDTGMGITKNEQKNIFKAFYRSPKVTDAAIRGTGLGLNIAKQLVELMGGTISVESKLEKGSLFNVLLPLKQKQITNNTTDDKPILKDWKKLKILVVEDDVNNYNYMEALLQKKVERVDHAFNGLEAIALADKNSYDLVLMDLKMPVMDGYEATRQLKQKHPNLPVIATTAYALPEEKLIALEAGCDFYLSKPVKKEDIVSLINQYVMNIK